MITSTFRGHKIEFINNEWVFSDTKEPTVGTWENRPCSRCGKFATVEGHDACLGTLPGVMNACCGHGEISEAYVQFENGNIVQGSVAIEVIKILKMQRRE